MRADAVGRPLVMLLGGLLAVLVATGAVLPAQPFDAWTTIPSGENTGGPSGEHALDPSDSPVERVRRMVHAAVRRATFLGRQLRVAAMASDAVERRRRARLPARPATPVPRRSPRTLDREPAPSVAV